MKEEEIKSINETKRSTSALRGNILHWNKEHQDKKGDQRFRCTEGDCNHEAHSVEEMITHYENSHLYRQRRRNKIGLERLEM